VRNTFASFASSSSNNRNMLYRNSAGRQDIDGSDALHRPVVPVNDTKYCIPIAEVHSQKNVAIATSKDRSKDLLCALAIDNGMAAQSNEA
jgi:hypothetical protein